MGRDKATLQLDGVSLVEHVAKSLTQAVQVVRVVGRADSATPTDLPRVLDTHETRAPMVGLYAALNACEASALLLVACDLPFIRPELVIGLLGLVPIESEFDAVVPRSAQGAEPLLAVYRPRTLSKIEARINAGRLSLNRLLNDLNTLWVDVEDLRSFDPELDSFRNLNQPEDLP